MKEMTVSVPEAGRARGHNALLAALDTEINIKDSDGARKAKAKK